MGLQCKALRQQGTNSVGTWCVQWTCGAFSKMSPARPASWQPRQLGLGLTSNQHTRRLSWEDEVPRPQLVPCGHLLPCALELVKPRPGCALPNGEALVQGTGQHPASASQAERSCHQPVVTCVLPTTSVWEADPALLTLRTAAWEKLSCRTCRSSGCRFNPPRPRQLARQQGNWYRPLQASQAGEHDEPQTSPTETTSPWQSSACRGPCMTPTCPAPCVTS